MRKSEKGREYMGIEVREEKGGLWIGGYNREGGKRGRMELDGNAIILAEAPSSLKLTAREGGDEKSRGGFYYVKIIKIGDGL